MDNQMHPPSQLLHTLAADFCCQPEDFFQPGVTFHEVEDRPGRRRFPLRARSMTLATMGGGVIICCDRTRLDWARENLSHLSTEDLFAAPAIAKMQAFVQQDGQTMAGPDLKFICSSGYFEPACQDIPPGIDIELYTPDRVLELFQHPGFNYAIRYQPDNDRPNMLAAVARAAGLIIGIAGATADSDCLWQVGIKVLDEWQSRGIGKLLVSRLTQAILQAGKIPYYSTWPSNIVSQRLARSVGYKIAWTELYAR